MTLDVEAAVRAAQGGDRQAFSRLVSAFSGPVCAIAIGHLRDVEKSQDVAQDVFVAAWQGLARLRDPRSFSPWLRQLARNRSLEMLRGDRRYRRRVTAIDDFDALARAAVDPALGPSDRMLAEEERRIVADALAAVPDDAREVLVLYYREGRSASQVAALLELREDAVRKRLSRAREKLEVAFAGRLEGVLARSAPGAAFTLTVTAALTAVAPPTAAAAGLAGAHAGGKAALGVLGKLLPLSGAALGGALGLLGVWLGLRGRLRRATSDVERAALRRFGLVSGTVVVIGALGLGLGGAAGPSAPIMIAAYSLMAIGISLCHVVWLPRICAEREALERAADPGAARRQRRELWIARSGLLFGVASGGATLAWVLLRALASRP